VGRPKKPLILTEEERELLLGYTRRGKTSQQLALRARIVLACAEGKDNQDVARELGLCDATVCKWRARFVSKRLDGLLDEPRPGAPRPRDLETRARDLEMARSTAEAGSGSSRAS